MSNDLYMAFAAARHFVTLDERSAGCVIESIARSEDEGTASGEIVAKGKGGAVIRVGRIESTGLCFEALVEPAERAVTLLGIGPDLVVDALHKAATVMMRVSLRRRPVVPVIGLELSTAEIQESMRALLEQYQQVVVERAPGTEAVRLTGGRVRVSTRLFGNAKRWKTTDARAAFKDVLDLAATAPQVVERDGRELLIIDRELLQRFEKPLSGAELVERLSQNPLEPLVFQKELEREPPPAIRAFEGA